MPDAVVGLNQLYMTGLLNRFFQIKIVAFVFIGCPHCGIEDTEITVEAQRTRSFNSLHRAFRVYSVPFVTKYRTRRSHYLIEQ